MVRKTFLVVFLCLLFGLGTLSINADNIEKNDVKIDANEYVGDPFFATDKGDEIDIKVSSDIPVNVYIVTSDDYFELGGPDVDKAKYTSEYVTSTKFTFKIPDDQIYYLVIVNPNNTTATVDYEYTSILDEEIAAFAAGVVVCGIIAIVIIVVIIVIIIYFTRNKKQQLPPQPYYPPPPPSGYPPPQVPGYPPQQQPGYPPQQPKYPPH